MTHFLTLDGKSCLKIRVLCENCVKFQIFWHVVNAVIEFNIFQCLLFLKWIFNSRYLCVIFKVLKRGNSISVAPHYRLDGQRGGTLRLCIICRIQLHATLRRLPKRLFTHAANYVYTIIVIMYRLDAIAANRWLLTNAAKRTSLTICLSVCLYSYSHGDKRPCALLLR